MDDYEIYFGKTEDGLHVMLTVHSDRRAEIQTRTGDTVDWSKPVELEPAPMFAPAEEVPC